MIKRLFIEPGSAPLRQQWSRTGAVRPLAEIPAASGPAPSMLEA